MPKKEAQTDIWVHDLLKSEGIILEYQGCSIKEVNDALKTASKSGKGNAGFPEFCGVVNDFLVVIEDKADLTNHIYRDPKGLIDLSTEAVKKICRQRCLSLRLAPCQKHNLSQSLCHRC